MGCHLRCTKPLREPMLTTCQLNTIGAHFSEILIKIIVHWNNGFQNVVGKSGKHFVQAFVVNELIRIRICTSYQSLCQCSISEDRLQSLYSLRGRTSYHQISWNLEAARSNVIMIVSLWNLTGISTALLPECLSNVRAIGKVSRLRDFTRSCSKTPPSLLMMTSSNGQTKASNAELWCFLW